MVEVTDEVRRATMEYLTVIIRARHPDTKPVEAIRDDHPALLALARIYQRGKIEGARLAIEALTPFADCCDQIADDESDEEWAKFRLLVKDYRRARDAIRALSPAKIVGEG